MWIVEIDRGAINWVPICICASNSQAEACAARVMFDPVRVRKYGEPAPLSAAAGQTVKVRE